MISAQQALTVFRARSAPVVLVSLLAISAPAAAGEAGPAAEARWAEITNGQYRACVQALACKPAAFEDPRSSANLKTGKSENAAAYRSAAADDQPAVGVSWHDAKAYCGWAGKRLPTLRELHDRKPAIALWLADAIGKKRAVRGGKARGAEEPAARAAWLSFRCAP